MANLTSLTPHQDVDCALKIKAVILHATDCMCYAELETKF